LSNCLGCSYEEVEDMYNNYNSKIKIGNEVVKNYNLNFLSKEKIDYLNEREMELKNIAGPTIKLAKDEIMKKETKKMY